MDKYIVKVINVFSNLIEVNAASEEEARHNALKILENSEEPLKNYYESTLPPDNWSVILKSDFDNIKAQVEKELKTKDQEEKASEEKSNIIVP